MENLFFYIVYGLVALTNGGKLPIIHPFRGYSVSKHYNVPLEIIKEAFSKITLPEDGHKNPKITFLVPVSVPACPEVEKCPKEAIFYSAKWGFRDRLVPCVHYDNIVERTITNNLVLTFRYEPEVKTYALSECYYGERPAPGFTEAPEFWEHHAFVVERG